MLPFHIYEPPARIVQLQCAREVASRLSPQGHPNCYPSATANHCAWKDIRTGVVCMLHQERRHLDTIVGAKNRHGDLSDWIALTRIMGER